MHAIGDAANRLVLDAFEPTAPLWQAAGRRPRIEHAQLLDPDDVGRFARLGVTASVQPSHAPSDRAVAQPAWGDRCNGAYAYGSLARSGATLAFGSDAPIEPVAPLAGAQAAATRDWPASEALSVEHALAGFWTGAAYARHAERDTGRLAAGRARRPRRARAGSLRVPARRDREDRGRRDHGRRPLGARAAAVVRIAVTRDLPAAGLEVLGALGDVWVNPDSRPLGRDELHAAARGVDALVTMPADPVDAALLDAAGPRLRIVANFAVGFDNIDVEACRARGVAATNTPDSLVETTADLAFALILAASRRLGEGERLVHARQPWAWSWDFMLGRDVWGSTLGIVGLGSIGRAVARRALGFGMQVVYAGRRDAPPEVEAELRARRVPLDELLATADVVSLHVPLGPATRHLIDAAALERMRPTAVLVNTARGPIVDEAALAAALRDGQIGAAGLDVFECAAGGSTRDLLACENAVLVPHIGSATWATRERMALRAARNVEAVLSGRAPIDPLWR